MSQSVNSNTKISIHVLKVEFRCKLIYDHCSLRFQGIHCSKIQNTENKYNRTKVQIPSDLFQWCYIISVFGLLLI
jgi:hypothetical protein